MAGFDASTAITTAAAKYGVDPDLALSIGHAESGLNPASPDSSRGAIGTMQLMPATAKGLGVDPRDPGQNIDGGVRYIRQLQDRFGADHPDLIAAGYNAGPEAVAHHNGVPPYAETRAYVARVTAGLAPTLPDQGALDAAFGVQGGVGAPAARQTAPAPAGAPAAAPAAEAQLPDQAAIDAAFGVTRPTPTPAGGAFQVNPAGGSTYKGPDGKVYTRDGNDPNLLTDEAGNQFRVQDGQGGAATATPSQAPPWYAHVGAGFEEALSGLPDMLNPVHIALSGVDTVLRASHLGSVPKPIMRAYDTSGLVQDAFGALSGFDPRHVHSTTTPQRLERAAGAGLSAVVFPEDAGASIPSVARNAFTGVAGALTGQGAAEIAPDKIKPLAQIVGTAFGGMGAYGGIRAAGAVAGGVRTALDPYLAAASAGAAETQAGARLAGAATNLPATRNALEGTGVLVPDSQPTTGQLTGDTGLLALERGAQNSAAHAPAFVRRRSDQNAARVGALEGLQTGGDPQAVADHASEVLRQSDAASDAAVQSATEAAQAKAASLGGTANPEAHGADLRAAITDAEGVARQRESGLWNAIDPDGKLTGNVAATRQAASDIASNIPQTAKPPSGEEAAILETAGQLPTVAPVSDLIALRSRVSTAMRQELIANGRSPAYARLAQLRGAIQDNLSSTISDKVASDDAAVKAGQLPVAQTAYARLQAALDDAARTGQAVSFGGRGVPTGGVSAPGKAQVAGVPGAADASGGQPGPASGGPAVPGSPSFDEAAAGRLAAATAATKDRAATFGLRPVADVTATTGQQGQFRMPDGSVPGKFFHAGPAGFAHMQAALKAGGERAVGALEDYAASSLRRAAGNADGTIDPGRFARWRAAHQDALRALPEAAQTRFADAASAGEAVAEAASARTVALENAQKTAAAKLAGLQDADAVTRRVAQILASPTGTADMRALANTVRGNPDAMAGLRQAVVNHITGKLIGNTEAGTSGIGAIKSDQLQSFIRDNRGALSQVFSPEELGTMQAVAEDLQRSQRSNAPLGPAGSQTTPNKSLLALFVGGGKHVGLDSVGAYIGEHVGSALNLPNGAGGALGVALAEGAQMLRSVGVNRVNELVVQALLNPAVAKRLLARVPDNPVARTSMLRGLAATLARGAAVNQASQPDHARRQSPNAFQGLTP